MYTLLVTNGYIFGVANGTNLINPIGADEAHDVLALLQAKPNSPVGYDYRLKADDLEWELVELPPPAPDPDEEEISAEEALSQIQEVLGYEA